MITIKNENIILKDFLTIEKGQLADTAGNTFSRVRVNRQDASCVLVLNSDSGKIILTRQFRYGAASKTSEYLLEIVAGKVDEGEEPHTTAIRETEEEIGYQINKHNLTYLVSCYSSPAYTSERYHIYFAVVRNSDKKGKGGGLEQENESIEIVEMDRDTFKDKIRSSAFLDAKTYIAGQQAMLKNLV